MPCIAALDRILNHMRSPVSDVSVLRPECEKLQMAITQQRVIRSTSCLGYLARIALFNLTAHELHELYYDRPTSERGIGQTPSSFEHVSCFAESYNQKSSAKNLLHNISPPNFTFYGPTVWKPCEHGQTEVTRHIFLHKVITVKSSCQRLTQTCASTAEIIAVIIN